MENNIGELTLTCLECKHGECGEITEALNIRSRMEQHLKLYHPSYVSEDDFPKMVEEHREKGTSYI